jgi:preprotein translocase subunit SecE
VGAFVQELFRVSLYKRSQGRVARQATMGALALIIALGAWSLHNYFDSLDYSRPRPATGEIQQSDTESATPGATDGGQSRAVQNRTARILLANVLPLAVLVGGLWASFRVVQMPSFADFLIAVEGEMNKVSWPARGELFRASAVVMFVIFSWRRSCLRTIWSWPKSCSF